MEMCLLLHLGQLCHLEHFLTETQKTTLMERFQANEYLTKEEKHELAMSLNITEGKIANWYTRRRRKNVAEGVLSQSEFSYV